MFTAPAPLQAKVAYARQRLQEQAVPLTPIAQRAGETKFEPAVPGASLCSLASVSVFCLRFHVFLCPHSSPHAPLPLMLTTSRTDRHSQRSTARSCVLLSSSFLSKTISHSGGAQVRRPSQPEHPGSMLPCPEVANHKGTIVAARNLPFQKNELKASASPATLTLKPCHQVLVAWTCFGCR